ncbi:MAG: 3-oxoacyl-ACP synthase [Desulfobacterales bacterium]|nr:MAG: 3-oxoacyl-ACP synthase [Desulfobacterales bacterium]
MKPQKTVICGMDALCCLGTESDEIWKRLLAGESGIRPLTRFPVSGNFPVTVAGEAPEPDRAAYPFLSARSMALWPSPIFGYALLTVHRALKQAGIEITPDIASRTAITYSSAVGGQDALIAADRRLQSEGRLPPPYANPNSCINMTGGKISMLTGATGPITATITACATGATSIAMGSLLLESGRADLAICGAVDSPLVESIVAGFATMNAACRDREEEGDPHEMSRPFAVHRKGLVISEGAAALILTTAEFARAHGLHPLAELAGWSMTSDARHYVAPHLATVRRCMEEALADAGISPDQIDAVNAHGTSTRTGDRVEYEALDAVFHGRIPPLAANKSQIGHAMGAGSALESVFAIRGMEDRILPPTLNFRPDPALDLSTSISDTARSLSQEYALKNAFGFGGCNTCLVFRRIP